MSNVQADRSRRAGFTLIEVLVALAIAALGLGMMMMAAGTGLGNATLADQTIEATRRAQAHLATLGTLTPLRAGETSGQDDGGYFWRVRISEPAMHTAAATPAGMPLGLYTVDVTIIWRAGVSTKSVSLSSQRFGRVADGNG